MEIVNDLQKSEDESTGSAVLESAQQPTKIFLNKNNEFLEKEISFFISNLRNVSPPAGVVSDLVAKLIP